MSKKSKRSAFTTAWRVALAVIGIVAVAQELRKPKETRTWQGKVADLVPYDFRKPTIDRVKMTYWDPAGPVLPSKVFGVGWAVNFGALARMAGVGGGSDSSK